jgi:DNA polymerase-3 subunit epsilon
LAAAGDFMKLSELNVFLLDLQTTGSRPGDSDILEMAWANLQEPHIESVLVTPSTGFVPKRIQILTGITDSDMIDASTLHLAFDKLSQFLTRQNANNQKSWAVIHFAQFEKPFLLHAYQLFEQELPFEMICTHQIAKRLMPNLPTRGIKGLAGYFGYNSGDVKRSASHVEATRFIWKGLIADLEKQGIHTLEDLQAWLNETPATKRKKYEYPLAKDKRLSLPDQPGVYRMMSRWGEVLYVGKATSLHSRVNSYFRGQKNRDPRKLEMLTQTWDLQVTPCGSPLEAALLETDEIKRLNPRYNISLKSGGRAMVFFNRDFTSMSYRQDQIHAVGPFSNSLVMDSMIKLSQSVQWGVYSPMMFFEPISSELLEEGFALFCERHGFNPSDFRSVRSILAVAIWWIRHQRLSEILEAEVETADLVPATEENVGQRIGEQIANGEVTEEDLEELLALTVEDVADKYERHFLRAGRAYLRARQLTKLLNSDIDFQIHGEKKTNILKVRRGQIQYNLESQPAAPCPQENTADEIFRALWSDLSIDTYDRMSILTSELNKIKSQDGTVVIRNCSKTSDS